MYFENGKISSRQIYRLVVTEFLGITLLCSTGTVTGRCGREGLIVLVCGAVFALIYSRLIIAIRKRINGNVMEYAEKKAGRRTALAIAWIFMVKYAVFATGVMLILGVVVQRTLLQHYNITTVIIPAALLAIYGFRLDREARARFAEVAFYFVVIPAITVIVLAWGKCDRYNLVPFFMGKPWRVVTTAFWYMLVTVPAEMLLFVDGDSINVKTDADRGGFAAVSMGILTVAAFNVIYYIMNVGIFGVDSVSQKTVSSLELMQAAGHLESVMSLFLIISLYTLINCYGTYIILLLRYIFARKAASGKKTGYMAGVGIALCLAACTASAYGVFVESAGDTAAQVSLEDKDYIMVLGIDYVENKFEVVYGFDGEGDMDNVSWKGENLRTARDEYSYMASQTADFSHIKAIVLEDGVLKSSSALKNVREFLKNDETIADNTLVVCSDDKLSDVMDLSGSGIESMLDNNIPYLKCEVYELISAMANQNKTVSMALIGNDKENPVCEGIVVADGRGKFAQMDIKSANMLLLSDSNMSGNIICTEDNRSFKVISNTYDTDIRIINNETIGVNIKIRGILKNLTSYRAKEEDTSDAISERITDILTGMLEENKLDYLGVYDRLAVADRVMWLKYMEDKSDMYDRIYFNVECDFEIK